MTAKEFVKEWGTDAPSHFINFAIGYLRELDTPPTGLIETLRQMSEDLQKTLREVAK